MASEKPGTNLQVLFMYTYIQIKYKEKDDKRNIKCGFGQQTPTAWLINTC